MEARLESDHPAFDRWCSHEQEQGEQGCPNLDAQRVLSRADETLDP